VGPLLPGTAGSLVLITSRRRLAALDDAAVLSLDTLPPAEAAVLLARLAGRPDLGPGDAGVGEITRLCGYLPLAIGMLGRQLAHHPAWTAAGLAADLAAAGGRLELMAAENLSVAAAFGLSYRDLTARQRRLFRRLGLHPGPDIDAYAAAALDDTGLAAACRGLEALYGQHLITEPTRGRYRLHDLLREHARTVAAADDPAIRDAATTRLLDYYLHTARAAGQQMPSWFTAESPAPPGHPPASAPSVSTPRQAAAWLEAERANLHAAAGYAAASGRLLHAMLIPSAMAGFLDTRGYWDQNLALQQAAFAAARQAGDRPGQAHALLLLSLTQAMTEDLPAAAARATRALELYRDLGDRAGQAHALTAAGTLGVIPGDYPAAAAALRQALALSRDPDDPLWQAWALTELAAVQRLTGDYPAAAASSRQALSLYHDLRDLGEQAGALNELGLVQQLTGDYPAAAASHQQALQLCRNVGNRLGQAETLNSLGELSSRTAATRQARDQHAQALAIARDLGTAPDEARALEGIGRSHLQDGHASEGTACLRQALAIYQRIRSPAARRVQHTLRDHHARQASLTPAPKR
jgi:tetratricopeptide (TPR) repeat protein